MSQEFNDTIALVDGITFKITQQRLTFLFLSKVTILDNIRTLNFMITDSSDNFWLGDFDQNKITSIQESMKLQGSFQIFFSQLKEMLKKKKIRIELERKSEMEMIVQFDLQGIILNARFDMGRPFKRSDNESLYYNLTRVFVLDLFAAHEQETMELEEENKELKTRIAQLVKKAEETAANAQEERKEDHYRKYAQSPANEREDIFLKHSPEKPKPKTSIFNPQMRKRKAVGAKISSKD